MFILIEYIIFRRFDFMITVEPVDTTSKSKFNGNGTFFELWTHHNIDSVIGCTIVGEKYTHYKTYFCILAECSNALRLLSTSALSFLLSVYSAAFSLALLNCSYCITIIRSCHLCMPSSSSRATRRTRPVCCSLCKLITFY